MVVVTGTMIGIGTEEDRMIVKLVNVVHEDDVIYHLNLWIQIAAVLKLEITSWFLKCRLFFSSTQY